MNVRTYVSAPSIAVLPHLPIYTPPPPSIPTQIHPISSHLAHHIVPIRTTQQQQQQQQRLSDATTRTQSFLPSPERQTQITQLHIVYLIYTSSHARAQSKPRADDRFEIPSLALRRSTLRRRVERSAAVGGTAP